MGEREKMMIITNGYLLDFQHHEQKGRKEGRFCTKSRQSHHHDDDQLSQFVSLSLPLDGRGSQSSSHTIKRGMKEMKIMIREWEAGIHDDHGYDQKMMIPPLLCVSHKILALNSVNIYIMCKRLVRYVRDEQEEHYLNHNSFFTFHSLSSGSLWLWTAPFYSDKLH